MGKRTVICVVSLFIAFTSFSQINKGKQHAGVSGMPVFDIFNIFPDNEIAGGALNMNYGIFVHKNFSVGLNIYGALASNEYGTEYADFHKEIQKIRLVGLNANFRYYHAVAEKISIYAGLSFGFGYYHMETTNLSTSQVMTDGIKKESVLVIMPGFGINYKIMNNLMLELNLQYIFLNRLTTDPYAENFHTVVPTVGIQYFWN